MIIKDTVQKSIIELKHAGIPTPELDIKVLLSHALDKDSIFLYSHSENLLTNREYSKFRKYIRRRKTLEPVAYITGHKEFYGYDFFINKNVLVPRPETEFLVEETLRQIKENNIKKLKILDVGTGSGCIIISIAKELSKLNLLDKSQLYATDNSQKALYVAKKNAKNTGVRKNIKFYFSNLMGNNKLPKKFDIIIANLPYVPIEPKNSKRKSIDFEPQGAIYANDNGTKTVLTFLKELKDKNIVFNHMFLELDSRNIIEIFQQAKKIFRDHKFEIKKDIAGKNRYLSIGKN